MERDKQIEGIYQLITQLASGDLSYRGSVSDKDNELDAITLGINMLAEELQSSTVSRNYLGRVYKGVVDMLIVLNPDNTVSEVNTAVTRLLNFTEDELRGKHVSTLFMRTEAKTLDRINRELQKKGYAFDIERVFKTKRGKAIPVSLSCSLLYDDNENVNGILYIAKDITKPKRTEQQLREKNEELNTFIYRASHDLKGPLASIIGLVNLAKSEMTDTESVKYYLELIERSSARLDIILNEFLELGRLTQTSMKYTVINFDQIIKEILQSMEYLDSYKNVDIRINVDHSTVYRSKRPLIKAILQNLIDNAIKYKNPASKALVDINVMEVDKEIVISVYDNGIGMDKNVLENVFKMFYRGSQLSEGSGLGLYIVNTSVDNLKGRIEVKSKPGAGSRFTIFIPNRIK